MNLELTVEDAVANRIKSKLKTLDGYRKTSMVAHNRVIQPVFDYASALSLEMSKYAEEYEGYPQVERWVRKFYDYCDTYDLL